MTSRDWRADLVALRGVDAEDRFAAEASEQRGPDINEIGGNRSVHLEVL